MRPTHTIQDRLVEELAAIEHEQWMHWSKAVASEVSAFTRHKWAESWRTYAELPEALKDADRIWARKAVRRFGRILGSSRALILVDLQSDFLPGGALPVPEGDAVIPLANELQEAFDLVVATQDWHPDDHGSFAANHPGKNPGDIIRLDGLKQILWPTHCVQDSRGAEFAPGLDQDHIERVFRKGTDPAIDSYSGFFDNGHRRATGLGDYLKAKGVTDVFVMGLATDYCVKFTALDAVALGFRTYLIEDACRGVNLMPDDVANAIAEMRTAGVVSVRTGEVMAFMCANPAKASQAA